MQKLFLLIAAFGLMLLFSAGIAPDTSKMQPGQRVPQLETTSLDGSHSNTPLNFEKGRWHLLTLWSPADAPSRVRLNNYHDALKAQRLGIRHQAVATNGDAQLTDAVLTHDGISLKDQYLLSSHDGDMANVTLLIDPNGRIKAVNPEPEQLARIIKN